MCEPALLLNLAGQAPAALQAAARREAGSACPCAGQPCPVQGSSAPDLSVAGGQGTAGMPGNGRQQCSSP
jgi:hypothetical protein